MIGYQESSPLGAVAYSNALRGPLQHSAGTTRASTLCHTNAFDRGSAVHALPTDRVSVDHTRSHTAV